MIKFEKMLFIILLSASVVAPQSALSATLKVSVVDEKGTRISDALAYINLLVCYPSCMKRTN